MKKLVATLLISLLITTTLSASETINVYSARIENLIKPAFDAFTAKTGIKVRFTTAKEVVLLERLKAEGKHTKADLLITVDAGNLWLASREGVLKEISSTILEKNIPSSLRDPSNRWFGLTLRARTIVYSKKRVQPSELSTYEALGDKKWEGRLCLRTSKKVYNKSLVASFIGSLGEKKAKAVLQSWMDNRAKIYPKDSTLLKAIAAGKCDVGIANTYYLGRELKKNPAFPVALFWANQQDRGVHVNISGAGVTKYAKHPRNAIKLLEFLSSSEAQNLFADSNMEFPANSSIKPNELLVTWWGSDFKQDSINISIAGKLQKKAVILMNQVGYK